MNTTRLLPLLLLATLGGSTFADVCDIEPAASWKWTPEGVPAGLCDGIHNSHRCVQRIEPHTLRQAPEGVERAAGVLRIAVPRGDTVVFEDREGERGPFYLYLGHLPSGHHLVFVQHYEGGDHVLVDDVTGAQSPLGGRPIFAPGGEYLAAVKSGYAGESLRIFRLTGETWTQEWNADAGIGGARIAWRSAERLDVCSRHDRDTGEEVSRSVVLGDDGWGWVGVGPGSPGGS